MLISRFRIWLMLAIALCVNATSAFAVTVNPPIAITHTVTVQPIIVSDTGGGNTAEFFGTPSQQSSIESLIDMVWAQAGIDVNFLGSNSWNNTFANSGTPGSNNPRPTSDLNDVVNNATAAGGIIHADPNVINMFFVNIPAGFSLLTEDQAAGLAFTPGNGITQYVGSNLLDFGGGRDVIASVVAHEIGHNLGLPHLVEALNLMQAGGSPNQGEILNATQIQTALASNFSVPVPVPAAVWLFATGLIGLAGAQRRKEA